MKRSRNQRYHDRVAHRYDDVHADDPYHALCREISFRHLKPHLPRRLATPVLDAGCGTGLYGLRLAKSGYPVDFLDLSEGMLEQARRGYAALGAAHKARFVRADLERPEGLAAGCYGLVLAQGDVLSFVADPDRALRAVRTLLAPGGILLAAVDQRFAGVEHYMERGDLKALARFLKDGRTSWLGGARDERFPMRMFTPAEARRLFAAAGFEVLSMIGKTVLPLRRHRELLADPARRRELLRLEEAIHGVEQALGLAPHLEILARAAGR